jgi:hypothetical protein
VIVVLSITISNVTEISELVGTLNSFCAGETEPIWGVWAKFNSDITSINRNVAKTRIVVLLGLTGNWLFNSITEDTKKGCQSNEAKPPQTLLGGTKEHSRWMQDTLLLNRCQ